MGEIQVEELVFDEHNLAHLSRHGISALDVVQVVGIAPLFRRNARARAASHQMIGPTASGAMLTICLSQTDRANVWRPITGWDSTERELEWYNAYR